MSAHFMLDVQRQAALDVLEEVFAERVKQHATHGEQNLPDGTCTDDSYGNLRLSQVTAQMAKASCDRAFAEGRGTFHHVLNEEFLEAVAERDPAKLRAELVQVAACATQWVEAIDRRSRELERVTEDSEVAP